MKDKLTTPEALIGRKIKGFKFEDAIYNALRYDDQMDEYIGQIGTIETHYTFTEQIGVRFDNNRFWAYPASLIEEHLIPEEDNEQWVTPESILRAEYIVAMEREPKDNWVTLDYYDSDKMTNMKAFCLSAMKRYAYLVSASKDKEIANLQAVIEAKDRLATDLADVINKNNKEIARLHQELDLRCEYIKTKDRLLEESLKTANDTNAELIKQVGELKDEIEKTNREWKGASMRIVEYKEAASKQLESEKQKSERLFYVIEMFDDYQQLSIQEFRKKYIISSGVTNMEYIYNNVQRAIAAYTGAGKKEGEVFLSPDNGDECWGIGSGNFNRKEVAHLLHTQRAMIANDLKSDFGDNMTPEMLSLIDNPRKPVW